MHRQGTIIVAAMTPLPSMAPIRIAIAQRLTRRNKNMDMINKVK